MVLFQPDGATVASKKPLVVLVGGLVGLLAVVGGGLVTADFVATAKAKEAYSAAYEAASKACAPSAAAVADARTLLADVEDLSGLDEAVKNVEALLGNAPVVPAFDEGLPDRGSIQAETEKLNTVAVNCADFSTSLTAATGHIESEALSVVQGQIDKARLDALRVAGLAQAEVSTTEGYVSSEDFRTKAQDTAQAVFDFDGTSKSPYASVTHARSIVAKWNELREAAQAAWDALHADTVKFTEEKAAADRAAIEAQAAESQATWDASFSEAANSTWTPTGPNGGSWNTPAPAPAPAAPSNGGGGSSGGSGGGRWVVTSEEDQCMAGVLGSDPVPVPCS